MDLIFQLIPPFSNLETKFELISNAKKTMAWILQSGTAGICSCKCRQVWNSHVNADVLNLLAKHDGDLMVALHC